jgi:ATP-dependent helicase HrpB
VAAGFPDRIARAVRSEGGQATFQLATGRLLGASGELASSPWIVAIDADAGVGAEPGRLHSGAALSEESALELLAPRARDSVVIEWSGAGYKARKRREAEAFILSDTPIGRPDASALRESFARHIADRGLAVLPWDEECKNLLARIRAFWRSRFGESGSDPSGDALPLSFPFPDDNSLAATAKAWLLPAIRVEANPVMEAKGLARALGGIVPARYREAFGVDAPDSISLPAGMRRRLDYGTEGTVRLEAGIHEFFGLRIHPRALGKPIVACLLSPAGRPVQITTDIPGFWRGSWKDVRKDLRGRYPRHDWPEDPSTAQPRTGSRKPRPG